MFTKLLTCLLAANSQPPTTAAARDDTAPLLADWMMQEYKILQDKIDKIGAAYLTIRGWAVTSSGLIIAGGYAASQRYAPVFALGLVILFQIMEARQRMLSGRFGARVRFLEKSFRRLQSRGSSPGLEGLNSRQGWQNLTPSIAASISYPPGKSRFFRGVVQYIVRHSDGVFYGGLYVLLLAMTLLSESSRHQSHVLDTKYKVMLDHSGSVILKKSGK